MDAIRVSTSVRFRVLRTLGEGATSRVFEVEDRLHSGRFALKKLRSDYVTPERVARFKDEFRVFQHISHPNLSKNYELISDDTGIYLLMEFVDGVDFLHHVRAGSHPCAMRRTTESDDTVAAHSGSRAATFSGELRIERLRAALPQLVSGLCALHAAHKVHCDIKPENVLVTAEGRVVIVDFGLATATERKLSVRRGTPEFMAPEQFAGVLSEAVDWYAVGVLLYSALSGRLPITDASYSLEHAKRYNRPIDPRIQAIGLPDDLVNLALRLLEAEPSARPSAREIAQSVGLPAQVSASALVPFVGRESELRRLEAALEAASSGARVVYVHGESGIGKTTLVQRFVNTAEARGCSVFRSVCYLDASVPYVGFDGIADGIAARVAREPITLDPVDHAALITMFPVFGRATSQQAEQTSEPDAALLRARSVRALRKLLGNLAGSAPLVLWIDDIQWTDVESVELLSDILQLPPPRGVLFIASHRVHVGSAAERVRYARGHLPCDEELALGPLDTRALQTILEVAGPIARSELDAIVRESHGNPFFVSELLRARVSGYPAESLSLDALLSARTARLPAGHRDYLELVSIAVRPLDEAVLQGALAVSKDVALEARRVLLAASMIRMADNGDRAIETYHDRIREHVLASLRPERTRMRHAALAAAYAASGVSDAATLAVHYRAAGNLSEALTWTVSAADTSRRALAFDHAAELYFAACGLADGTLQHDMRVQYGLALSNAGRPSEAAKAFVAAIDAAHPDVQLQLCAGDEFLRAGAIDSGLERIRAVAHAIGEPFPRGQNTALLSLIWNGLRLGGLRIVERSTLEPVMAQRLALCLSIARRLVMVEFLLAARFQLRYLQLALSCGSHEDIVQGLALQACFSAQMPSVIAGGVKRAEQLFSRAQALVRDTDSPLTRACVMFAPGAIALAHGRWRDCRISLEKVVVLLQEKSTVGLRWDAAFSQSVITQMLWLEGDLTELRARMHGHLREAKGHLMAESVHVLRGSAMLALCDDRVDRARDLAAGTMKHWAAEPWRIPHHFNVLTLNEIDLYEGRPLDALARQRATRQHSKKAGFHQVSLYLLTDTIVRARTTLAAELYADAALDIAMLRGRKERWGAAVGDALLACWLVARGLRESATPVLELAIVELERWELGLFASAARHRLGQLRSDSKLQSRTLDEMARRGIKQPERFIASLLPWPT